MLRPHRHPASRGLVKRLGDRLTYANVISTICLFVLLGGGAYAAAKLPKHSVGAKQLKVGAVRSPQVKDGSLLARDFKVGQLPAGAPGARGPEGQTGPRGPEGPAGPIGPSEVFHVTIPTGPADIVLSPNYTTVLEMSLPPGTYVLSGNLMAADKSTTEGVYVRCALTSDTDPAGVDNYPVELAKETAQAIPLQGVRVVTGTTSIQYLICRKSGPVTVEIGEDPEMTAIKVGSLAP